MDSRVKSELVEKIVKVLSESESKIPEESTFEAVKKSYVESVVRETIPVLGKLLDEYGVKNYLHFFSDDSVIDALQLFGFTVTFHHDDEVGISSSDYYFNLDWVIWVHTDRLLCGNSTYWGPVKI